MRYKLFLNGKWEKGGGTKFTNNSLKDKNKWEGYSASNLDVKNACLYAKKALPIWMNKDIKERIQIIKKFCEIVDSKKDIIAEAISSEIGKIFWESKTEVQSIVRKIDPTLDAFKKRNADFILESGATTRFFPIGVVAVIGPSNFPIHMPNVHIMPALLAGNTVVLKQSEVAPLSGELIIECWQQAGLPDGVMNLLQGDGTVGEELCANDSVNGIFFTGSANVGNNISKLTAGSNKLLVLEMGGNSPLVFWDTSCLDASVIIAIQSCFISSGQRCSSARRLIVQNNKQGLAFLHNLIKKVQQLKLGMPFDEPQPFIGPLINKKCIDDVLNLQSKLISKGAKPLLLAEKKGASGRIISPGIIDVTNIDTEEEENEILAPFITVKKVESIDDAILACNTSQYGLATSIITENDDIFTKFRLGVDYGIISRNASTTGNSPYSSFSGVKASGNYRPTGYYSCDYVSRAVGGIERDKAKEPQNLPPGVV